MLIRIVSVDRDGWARVSVTPVSGDGGPQYDREGEPQEFTGSDGQDCVYFLHNLRRKWWWQR